MDWLWITLGLLPVGIVLLAAAKEQLEWRKCKPTKPLPKINILEERVGDYLIAQKAGHKLHTKRKLHHEDHMWWVNDYNSLLSDLETARFYKEHMGRPIADAPALGYTMPTAFRPETVEKSLLEQIQALTARYGFDHHRTQRVVQFHQERINLHKRNWERWNKNDKDA